ncbi:uncharacterized protein LOC126377417 isoform X2 [Pectinophora gossypiella]|uniref:uncharacterized protein LOC126377417 isoform X2 n=1 Tax=Pectinophora gossypiella TaxID=13191 RepID=UPI00214F5A00|nr:uncharacterized protein LOC126377417 isoform X2 [Pectinophora gossypiella]
MEVKPVRLIIFNIFLAVNIHTSLECPSELEDAKAAYKSGEIFDQSGTPITLDKIKTKLKDSGIFDVNDTTLNEREKKELSKLFEAVEIMTTSRARQPGNVQNVFSSIRIVERAVKKQLKEGQISETLAAKFNWDKLKSNRIKRSKPLYSFNKETKMRDFDTSS